MMQLVITIAIFPW